MGKKPVVILRSGNCIAIKPPTSRLKDALEHELSYMQKSSLRGKERYKAIKFGRPTTFSEEIECFTQDHKGRLVTCYGFLDRIQACLGRFKRSFVLDDLTRLPRPDAYKSDWKKLNKLNIEYRPGQREALELLTKYECGRIDCPTAWGKSFTIGLACLLFPHAKIAVTSRNNTLVMTQIYPELSGMMADVGLVGGGKRHKGARVTCYTGGSIHHADGDEDFVFVDECHEAGADNFSYKMSKFRHAHLWGLSASHDMRMDGKDFRCEGMFGPVRMAVSYQEAQAAGIVSPMVVQWSSVASDFDPGEGEDDLTEAKRLAIWTNDFRNRIIARDAREFDADTQVLISVETIEHALHLKRFLPEFELVYSAAGLNDVKLRRFQQDGLLYDGFKPMTQERRDKLTRRFAKNKLKKAIATTVWNVGVNFKWLEVLLRADGGSSEIASVQIPGRAARIVDGKKVGIIRDYKDEFSQRFGRRAASRGRIYKRLGWPQHEPRSTKQSKSFMRELLEKGIQ